MIKRVLLCLYLLVLAGCAVQPEVGIEPPETPSETRPEVPSPFGTGTFWNGKELIGFEGAKTLFENNKLLFEKVRDSYAEDKFFGGYRYNREDGMTVDYYGVPDKESFLELFFVLIEYCDNPSVYAPSWWHNGNAIEYKINFVGDREEYILYAENDISDMLGQKWGTGSTWEWYGEISQIASQWYYQVIYLAP